MNPIMAAIVDTTDTLNISPEDYINPDDRLKYCGKCHTPKVEQYRKNGLDRHPIDCKCAAEERRSVKRGTGNWNGNRIVMLRSKAFRDIPDAGWRFENADVMTPQLTKARSYSENWDELRRAGTGLLLFGNVGTGKSYAAGCIANALIEKMVSVMFVGLSDVVNRMQGNFGADRDAYLKTLMRPELLILDDLGAERNTSFGMVSIHLKMTLTSKEAAEYSNIGINKIDSMTRSPNCPFLLFVGSKKLVKRKKFEQYISQALVI